MPPLTPTTAVAVTTSPISTLLPSSVTPTSMFDSPFSVFSATRKEMPIVSAAHEATSARDTAVSDAGGSSSGIVDDGPVWVMIFICPLLIGIQMCKTSTISPSGR
ncbi:hypothetical protein Hanom_Chr07g00637341 [Helianthus anomalus]